MEKKKNDFIAQGSILAIASILVRVMGMIYRIPMTAIIGDKGNGFYSYAYSVYTILLLLSSYSLPLAVSKMVSAKAQLGQWRNVKRVFICAIAFAIGIGTTFGLIVLIGAQFFTRVFFHSELAAIALRFISWFLPGTSKYTSNSSFTDCRGIDQCDHVSCVCIFSV